MVAWPTERTEPVRGGDLGIEFTVRAQVLRETEGGRLARERGEARVKAEGDARLEEEARLKGEEAKAGEEDDAKLGGQGTTEEASAETLVSAETEKDEL